MNGVFFNITRDFYDFICFILLKWMGPFSQLEVQKGGYWCKNLLQFIESPFYLPHLFPEHFVKSHGMYPQEKDKSWPHYYSREAIQKKSLINSIVLHPDSQTFYHRVVLCLTETATHERSFSCKPKKNTYSRKSR